jgi:hypothetical protein
LEFAIAVQAQSHRFELYARMLNIGDASKIDEQEQALRRITSILAERPEKTLDPSAPNGILQPT